MKNLILLGDIYKNIYFLSWKEQGAQLTSLTKDFGSLDFHNKLLINMTTLSPTISDDQTNVRVIHNSLLMLLEVHIIPLHTADPS